MTYMGHEHVDLGLSVLWAKCNIGAERPGDYGDYLAWGEMEPKDKYDDENYRLMGERIKKHRRHGI